MDAWVVARPGPIGSGPLERVRLPVPVPGPGEVLVEVEACGVCRTDLHLAEGDLSPRRPRTVPGHEVVGRVVASGPASERLAPGSRVGVAWLRSTCGRCRHCLRGAENLCPFSTYTGWDADGGYAGYLTVPEDYAYPLPEDVPAEKLAPLLCAGIIGYRALLRCDLPPGGRLGIYGFGGSAHLTAQVALAQGATVHVLTRSARARELARTLGAASAGGDTDAPPEPLDAAILFAPVGELVPVALAALDRGGVLAVAGIHLSDIPPELPAPPVPGTDAAQRHRQHPRRRPGVPGPRLGPSTPGDDRALPLRLRGPGPGRPGRQPLRGRRRTHRRRERARADLTRPGKGRRTIGVGDVAGLAAVARARDVRCRTSTVTMEQSARPRTPLPKRCPCRGAREKQTGEHRKRPVRRPEKRARARRFPSLRLFSAWCGGSSAPRSSVLVGERLHSGQFGRRRHPGQLRYGRAGRLRPDQRRVHSRRYGGRRCASRVDALRRRAQGRP
ncbi:zinc-binding alcohol dehydrogenase family protein [Streptosporangium lutulentum]